MQTSQVKITAANAQQDSRSHFTAKASELGFVPGHWPEELETDLGNRRDFVLMLLSDQCASYCQRQSGNRLTIWND